ncbi:unnamed protein product [Rhizoctonia solani]|uniref:Nephrocystin 3-like N-terminal domain-containing protein n=1 Tax=Rhizoctonia solani TaxID=456999 RepID=A0A8H2WU07_9AGAM|nr:unnamed protein product [Rhizoctonia solani]
MRGSKFKLRGHVVARFSRYWGRLQRADAEDPIATVRTRDKTSSSAGVECTRPECTRLAGLNETTSLATGDTTEGQLRVAPIHTPSSGVLETLGATLADLETVLDVLPSLRSVVSGLRICLALADVNVSGKIRQEYENIATNFASICQTIFMHIVQLNEAKIPPSIHGIIKDVRQLIIQIKLRRERYGIESTKPTEGFLDQEITQYRSILSLLSLVQVHVRETYTDARERLMDAIITHQRETPAFNALYNAVLPTEIHGHTCAPITCSETLNIIRTWATKTDGPKIFWMTGVAGSGKTTIAHTICECRDVHRIIPTIAFQLARFSKEYWNALFNPLEVQPDVVAPDIATQFKKLLVTPLLRVKGTLPKNAVVVIDALDECTDTDNAQALLELLLRHVDELPIKFLLTSRFQLAISPTLPLDSTVQYYQIDQSAKVRLYLDELDANSFSPLPPHVTSFLSTRSLITYIA